MNRLIIALTLFLSVNAFPQNENDSLKITQLIIDDYETLSNVDVNGHISNVTNDYILIEDGNIWDLEDEIKYLFNPTQVKRTNEFEFLKIDIINETATVIYKLKSTFDDNGKISEKNWAESIICKKINGVWKISLIHSTPIRKEH
jgi:hypothetical protein